MALRPQPRVERRRSVDKMWADRMVFVRSTLGNDPQGKKTLQLSLARCSLWRLFSVLPLTPSDGDQAANEALAAAGHDPPAAAGDQAAPALAPGADRRDSQGARR